MAKRFDLLVFDWDGTLMDSAGAIVRAGWAALRSSMKRFPDSRPWGAYTRSQPYWMKSARALLPLREKDPRYVAASSQTE